MNRSALVQHFIKLLGKHMDKKNYSDSVDLRLKFNCKWLGFKWTKGLNCELKEADNSGSIIIILLIEYCL